MENKTLKSRINSCFDIAIPHAVSSDHLQHYKFIIVILAGLMCSKFPKRKFTVNLCTLCDIYMCCFLYKVNNIYFLKDGNK